MKCVSAIALLALIATAAGQFSTASCSGSSCSPSQCVVASNTCTNTVSTGFSTSTVAAKLSSVACRACTQSPAAVCSSAALTSVWGASDSSVVAAYCNDQFQVVWSTGMPAWSTSATLAGIPNPPGSDAGCRLRTAYPQFQVYKIPLTPPSLNPTATQLTANTIPNILPAAAGTQQAQFPSAGAIGVGVNGVPLFPNYNNRGMPTWVSCEVDSCNSHAGKGYDYHFHGDPYNCLYNATSVTANHPNLIGYSLDGYATYGRYTTASQDNVNTALDNCGGHTHGSFGYHYHSSVASYTTTQLDGVPNLGGSISYTAYQLGPSQCWAGNISQIPAFASTSQVYYDRSKSASQSIFCDADFSYLQPCCGATQAYVQPGSGATVQTTSGVGTSTCSNTGGGNSGGTPPGSPGTGANKASGAPYATTPISISFFISTFAVLASLL